ncbi:unnamed protein product [Closterium sp. Yama58-4]|nr:unnamed protein product [Closterium sp. Yama58-4]
MPLIQPAVNSSTNGTSTKSVAPNFACLPRLAPPSDVGVFNCDEGGAGKKDGVFPSDEGEIVGPHSPRAGLRRSLTVVDGVSMVLGVVVGSGIFATPGVVLLDASGSPLLALLLWLLAGVVGYACCEVAFGELASFVFMWMFFFVSTGGALSILVVTFARYAVALLPGAAAGGEEEMEVMVMVVGGGCVLLLTLVNCYGVEAGTWLQNLLSLSKALLIAIILAATPAFIILQGSATAAANLLQPLPPLDSLDLSRLGAGLVAAIWAFDGWNCLGFLSEELKNPKRDLPRSLSIGMLIAVVICLSANVAYLCILPAQAIGISQVVAVDSVTLVFGPAAGRLVALLVAFNVLGSANGTLLCNARYFYAMAREGRLPRFFGAVTKGGAPYAALCLIGGWTMVLLFFAANQLEKLLDYFGIATWIFYGAVAAALFKLRWAFPNGPRPYEARFYPLPPVIALVAAVFLVITSLFAHPVPSMASLAFVFVAFPLYYITKWFQGQRQPSCTNAIDQGSPQPLPCFPPSPSVLPHVPFPNSPHPLPFFPHPLPFYSPTPFPASPCPLPCFPMSLSLIPSSPSLLPPSPSLIFPQVPFPAPHVPFPASPCPFIPFPSSPHPLPLYSPIPFPASPCPLPCFPTSLTLIPPSPSLLPPIPFPHIPPSPSLLPHVPRADSPSLPFSPIPFPYIPPCPLPCFPPRPSMLPPIPFPSPPIPFPYIPPCPRPCFPPRPSMLPPIPFPFPPIPFPYIPPSPSLPSHVPFPASPHVPVPASPHALPCFPPSPSLRPHVPSLLPPSPSLLPRVPFPASPHPHSRFFPAFPHPSLCFPMSLSLIPPIPIPSFPPSPSVLFPLSPSLLPHVPS